MPQLTHDQLAAALVEALGAAVEAGLGEAVIVAPGAVEAGPAWTSTVTVGGALTGQLELSVTATGARSIASKLLGMDEEPDASVLSDMLKEMWAQAIGVASSRPECSGVTMTVQAPQSATQAGGRGWVLSVNGDALAQVLVVGALAAGIAASRMPAAAAPAPARTPQRDVNDPNLAVLMDIDLPLMVRFARTDVTLKALTELGPGSIVDMGRSPEDPVDILVGGQVIAQGEVVVVSGNYGVRITSLLSPAERLTGLEA